MSHLIRQKILEVEVNGTEAEALAVQRTLSGLCRNHLAPAIERALDRSAPEAGHLFLEKVEIDVGTLQLDRLESDLADSVAQALGKWLREHAPLTGSPPGSLQGSPQQTAPGPVAGALRHKSARDAAMEALVHFLRNGSLPWWFRLPAGKTLEQMVVEVWQEAGKAELEAALAAHGVLAALAERPARIRLIRQFSPSFTEAVLAGVAPEQRQVADTIREELRLWEQQAAAVALPQSRQAEHPEAREGLYVEHAGLILLHPFLPRFFAALGIADEDRLLQPERALCLLHYLATGQPAAPEYELVLLKILCGIPLPAPVSADVALSGPEKEEAIALLEAVIGHWDALRNSSCDELRGAFLVRPGKVSLRDDGDWLLQVEAQTCDILLDQLPWGLSMVKLPWMERMLWVEWG